MNSMKLVIPSHLTPNNAVTPQRQSQFTPTMKAYVSIDQYNECNGMTSFMEFMTTLLQPKVNITSDVRNSEFKGLVGHEFQKSQF